MVDIVPAPGVIPLVPEGLSGGEPLQAPGLPDFRPTAWSTKAYLSQQFGETHTFFTPALLYLYLPLGGRDPYREFCEAHHIREPMLFFDLRTPIFDSFPKGVNQELHDPAALLPWQSSLCALPHAIWKAYREFLGRLTVLDRDHGEIYLVSCVSLVIADPVFFHRSAVLPDQLPLLEIGAVTFWTKDKRCYFKVLTRHPWRPTPAVFEPFPVEEHQLFLQALLKEHPNPYEFVEREGDQLPQEAVLFRRASRLYQDSRQGCLSGNTPFYDPQERRFPYAEKGG